MMTRIALISLCLLVFGANVGIAQSSTPPGADRWGGSVQGVQLSISMTNSIFKIGSSTVVKAATKNLSTNEIIIDIAFPTMIFDVLLTNDAGKAYHVTTPFLIRGLSQFVTLKPGEEHVDQIPVTFGTDVEPGNYTLKATHKFMIKKEKFALVSNLLKVQIER